MDRGYSQTFILPSDQANGGKDIVPRNNAVLSPGREQTAATRAETQRFVYDQKLSDIRSSNTALDPVRSSIDGKLIWSSVASEIVTAAALMKGIQIYRGITLGMGAGKTSTNITYLTKAGSYPSWNTVKFRYWNLMNGGKIPTGTAQVRMRATGEIKAINVSKELHHINGRTGADPHRFSNLKEVWPWEHQAIDPSRHTGYDFIQWVK